jgi:type II secretory pathway component PulM
MERVEDCLQRAEECKRLAETAPNPEERQKLLQMVQMWCNLAERRRQMLLEGGVDNE